MCGGSLPAAGRVSAARPASVTMTLPLRMSPLHSFPTRAERAARHLRERERPEKRVVEAFMTLMEEPLTRIPPPPSLVAEGVPSGHSLAKSDGWKGNHGW